MIVNVQKSFFEFGSSNGNFSSHWLTRYNMMKKSAKRQCLPYSEHFWETLSRSINIFRRLVCRIFVLHALELFAPIKIFGSDFLLVVVDDDLAVTKLVFGRTVPLTKLTPDMSGCRLWWIKKGEEGGGGEDPNERSVPPPLRLVAEEIRYIQPAHPGSIHYRTLLYSPNLTINDIFPLTILQEVLVHFLFYADVYLLMSTDSSTTGYQSICYTVTRRTVKFP